MVNRKYDLMEKVILDACKATLVKQNVSLNEMTYSINLNNALTAIIESDNYRYFTSNKGMRELVHQFSSDDFLDLIASRISEKTGEYVDLSLYKRDVNGDVVLSQLSKKRLRSYINYYSNLVIPELLSDDYFHAFDEDDDREFRRDLERRILNPKFYSPGHQKCREAILAGRQTACQFSEDKCAGMQAFSHVGKVRKNQEDSYHIDTNPRNSNFKIMFVADGMGGHNAGEIASNIITRELLKWFDGLSEDYYYSHDHTDLDSELSRVVLKANDEIKRRCHGGGTTLCAAIIREDNIYIYNIGDSKGFVLEDGNFIYTTKSDSLPSILGVPEAFERFHPDSNRITRAVGILNRDTSISGTVIPMKDGKTYNVVLCTDGVSDCLSDDEIANIVNYSDRDQVAYHLVDSALNRRSSFQEELKKCKVKAGIMGRFNYVKLEKQLESLGMDKDYEMVIYPGKDNATAVSYETRRGR